jgi:hypothetical protein
MLGLGADYAAQAIIRGALCDGKQNPLVPYVTNTTILPCTLGSH